MKKFDNAAKTIGALLVGVIAGATLGILFAPARGKKTRRKIKTAATGVAKGFKRKIKDEQNALRIKAEELEGLTEDKIDQMIDSVKHKADVLKRHN